MATVKRVPGPASEPLKAALKAIDGQVGKVGWFKGSQYPDGTPVALVAATQEYGWPEHNIPPRLGGRTTAAEKREEWSATAEKGSKAVLAGTITAPALMEVLGQKAAGDWRKHIAGPIQPALKPATVEARLRRHGVKASVKSISVTIGKPLVDTRVLLNTLTNTVEPAGGAE